MACKSTKVIKINDLSKTFTTDAGLPQTAIDNVGLTIPGGQIFGILGGAAAGKTTLVKLITGLLEPSA